jgi:N-methylhydantoinase A
MSIRVGIDIGGTFTDLVIIDDTKKNVAIVKVLTTPARPADAVEVAIGEAADQMGVDIPALVGIVHATTLVPNALIERRGANVGLITTEGFADTLEIGREDRYDMYDIFLRKPEPLVPRSLRKEVPERILADGSVEREIDLSGVEEVIRQLKAGGVESIAVSLLNAHVDARHEQALSAAITRIDPEIPVTLSSDVNPQEREYERTSTAVANAYVVPIVRNYVSDLEERLARMNFSREVLFMLSSLGLGTTATAKEFPIRLVESGPAAGALAAAHLASKHGISNVFSFDMGGTTAKACMIENGKPLLAKQFEVARIDRFKRGSGLPLLVPSVELVEIGAGGGSIARIDKLGLLKVGPRSASSVPGPACYGRGGTAPTVTDADLVLGYLDPEFFLGGSMKLDADAARAAIERDVASKLGTSIVEAAWGIHRVVNENMASAARNHAIERGKDIRSASLLAFGGAGPVHCWDLARVLRIKRLLLPFGSGALSALGLLIAPLGIDLSRTRTQRLDSVDWSSVNALLEQMEQEGRSTLPADLPADEVHVSRRADLRYVGQGHEVTVDLPPGSLGPNSVPAILSAFEEAYRRIYNHVPNRVVVEALNWHVSVCGPVPGTSPWDTFISKAVPGMVLKKHRPAYFGTGYVDTPVYDRYALAPGSAFDGPAIVEERESTIVIGPGSRCEVLADRSIVVEMPED